LRFVVDGRTFGKEQQDQLLGIVLGGMKEAIERRTNNLADQIQPVPIGNYRGFDVAAYCERDTLRFQLKGHSLHSPDNLKYDKQDEFKLTGLFSRIDNYLGRLDARIEDADHRRQQELSELASAKQELAKAFPLQEQLEILRKDVADVMTELKKTQANPAYISDWVPRSSLSEAQRAIQAVKTVAPPARVDRLPEPAAGGEAPCLPPSLRLPTTSPEGAAGLPRVPKYGSGRQR